MTLDHRPAGPGPLGTARGTLHAYWYAQVNTLTISITRDASRMARDRNARAKGTTGLCDLRAHHAHVSGAARHAATLAGRRCHLWVALSRRAWVREVWSEGVSRG